MPQKTWSCVLFAVLVVGALVAWTTPEVRQVGFVAASPEDSLPLGWEVVPMQGEDNRTQYTLVRTDSLVAVKAVSRNGAAGLVRRIEVDPTTYPVLTWCWKVEDLVEEGNARKKSGDDYAARVFVTFDYDTNKLNFFDELKYRALKLLGYDLVPTRALSYFWANQVPQGTILPNPYTDWMMMIAVESGSEGTGRWVIERRNIIEDYRRAFGEDPPPINGVAIMTDTDNTGDTAVAYYGDIVFRGEKRVTNSKGEE